MAEHETPTPPDNPVPALWWLMWFGSFACIAVSLSMVGKTSFQLLTLALITLLISSFALMAYARGCRFFVLLMAALLAIPALILIATCSSNF